MGATAGVYRATYKDPRTGKRTEATTWFATRYEPALAKTVKKYGFQSAAAAQRWRAEATLKRRNASVDAYNLTLEQLVKFVHDDYVIHKKVSLLSVESRAAHLYKSFSRTTLARLIDEHGLNRHIVRMREMKYMAATINRGLALLKRGFNLARRATGIAVPYIPKLSEADNVRQGFFEPEAFEQILKHLPADAALAAKAMHITGWRRMEILSRKRTDIEGGYLHLRPGQTKNKEGRAWPLKPDLWKVLAAAADTGPFIFHNPGEHADYWFRVAWDQARAAAGLPHALVHDFRRTAVRDLVKAGVDRDTVKRLVGHKTDSILTRYRIVRGDDLEDASVRLSAYRNTEKKPKKKRAKKIVSTRNETGTTAIRTGQS